MPNKSLGRGLSAFLDIENQEIEQNDIDKEKNRVNSIDVQNIAANPFQPRHDFDAESLQSLAESIKRKGILQPILVISLGSGKYQLVAGERRFRAAQMAGLSEIPAIVTDISEKDQLEIAILENIQREDLNPIEEAEAYKRLMNEFSYTQEELSDILGKSRSHVANILRLLTLPDDVKELIRQKKITFGHARALVGTEDASKLAGKIIAQSMSVRDTENFVKSLKDGSASYSSASSFDSSENAFEYGEDTAINKHHKYIDPEIMNVAHQISEMIDLQVNVKLKKRGGIIEISFKNFAELDRLLSKLNG